MSCSESDKRRSTFPDADRSDIRGSMNDGLTPTAPAEAVEWYLSHRDPELSDKSLQNQGYRLNRFLEFCEDIELNDLSELTGRHLHQYRVYRSERVKPVTLSGELQTLRVFLEFCASIDAVRDGMRERVQIPNVGPEDETKDELLENDRAEWILDNLDRFQYASREHVIMSVLWHTGIRLGSLRAIDLDDVDLDGGWFQLRHRPDTGTPLKNGEPAQRKIAIGPKYCEMLEAYMEHNRPQVTDDHGRAPLLTTNHGRMSEGTIREIVYSVTQPCEFGDCPHDADPLDCEFRAHSQRGGCPSSRSPHGIRRGSITYHLRTGVPLEVVSDRMDASNEVLEQHYDKRTEFERMERRREFLQEA